MNNMQEQGKSIKELAEWTADLTLTEQLCLLEFVLESCDDTRKKGWYYKICQLSYPRDKWIEIESWIEQVFIDDISKKPRAVAKMCIESMDLGMRMIPFIIKKAQKIKVRVQMRNIRKKSQTL